MFRLFWSVVLIILFSSCEKDETIISENDPPNDETIENSTLKAYVNKSYISLIGEKPSDNQIDEAVELLAENPRDKNIRKQVIQNLFSQKTYFSNEFDLMMAEYLNNTDSAEIEQRRQISEFNITTTDDPIILDIYEKDLERIGNLIEIRSNWLSEGVSIFEMHKAIVDNGIYDEINMGTENFVVSCFQNFIFRYPTTSELDNGTAMVDNAPSVFFLKNGSHKGDFIDIFFDSNAYYEGLVTFNYQRFLYREPTAEEISELAASFIATKDYQELQIKILTSDEFFGI